MLNKVYEWIKSNNLIENGDTVICAVSGGVDSLVMLDMLSKLSSKLNIKVEAAHFNHHIRPAEETDGDEKFTVDFCSSRGIPVHVGHGDVMGRVTVTKESVEEAARFLRYQYLNSIWDNAKIATAHHADDNLETMLMKIIRGCGSKGLAGIPPKRDSIIRPILCLSRDEIEEYAAENGIKHVTDSTNLCDDYLRNRIRHKIIPLLKEENSKVCVNSLKAAMSVREDCEFLDNLAEEALKESEQLHPGVYNVKQIMAYKPAVKNRVIMSILTSNGVEYSYKDVYKVLDGFESTRGVAVIQFSNGKNAVVSGGMFRFVRKEDIYSFQETRKLTDGITFAGKIIHVESVENIQDIVKDKNILIINKENIWGPLYVRSYKPGDKIKLPGGTKQVGRAIREIGIMPEMKDNIPVVCDMYDNVVGVIGVGIDMKYTVNIGDDAYIVSIKQE